HKHRNRSTDNNKNNCITVLWATVLYEAVYWLILILFGGQYHLTYLLARLPGLLFVNGAITGILKGILH
ncbi:MAG TPA: hypothetical protein DF480_02950, partial [Clostridiales bacterium]|nr:hypothetical protein [Clostridiales bacterium]